MLKKINLLNLFRSANFSNSIVPKIFGDKISIGFLKSLGDATLAA